MFGDARVGVVVPAHNESGLVGDVVRTMPSFVDRVFVVDDGSTDGTVEEARRAAAAATEEPPPPAPDGAAPGGRVPDGGGPLELESAVDARAPSRAAGGSPAASGDGLPLEDRVVVVRHETNRGRGAAVKTGYRLAIADDCDVVAVMDGDGQMDPDELSRLVAPIVRGDADYAKGDRLRGPDTWAGMSRFRLFGNVLLSLLTRPASGYWRLRDPQNGYTAISADALRAIDLDGLYDGYGFLNDVLVRLGAAHRRVTAVPMRARYGEETSGIRYATFVPSLSSLLLRRFLWRIAVAPPASLGAPLVVCYLGGFIALVLAAVTGLRPGLLGPTSSPPLLLVVGVAALCAGVLLDWWQQDRRRGAQPDPDLG